MYTILLAGSHDAILVIGWWNKEFLDTQIKLIVWYSSSAGKMTQEELYASKLLIQKYAIQ